ncbi:hypothetical protein C1N66_30915 (plasmid) [Bacillus cereus]|uniref:PRTase-CE domain-containing protein n=1 Tax=Bacillus cereus TaxID=1396 RepID=A0AB73US54_BACCE|nr:hypothetical protein [Bacillus cereus]HDR3523480.1 hypothetical protein [Bacillus pacificus]QHV07973.1 hypothetical protein C1N82_32775 [Bacillus cereus]QHV47433.1 hypothetical protein C1N66_30915 [Bacillus cereus]HDR3634037.1 hypothetical protein [Bacillus pacificus]HDR7652973.1 hypothetical protein [Bacillus pacificus]
MNEQKNIQYISSYTGLSEEKAKLYWEQLSFLAKYKYNSYRHYTPYTNFCYKLTNWLLQFENSDEKEIMLDFLINNLIYISEKEMIALMNTVIPEIVYPRFKKENTTNFIDDAHLNEYFLSQSIFVGLSDGARLDLFRYYNPELDNHQICLDFELSDSKFGNILRKLKSNEEKNNSFMIPEELKNNVFIVLLDDFSGSGISYIRFEDNVWKGKLFRLKRMLEVFKKNKKVNVLLVPYLATSKAIMYISKYYKEIFSDDINFEICPVQLIKETILSDNEKKILKKYYENTCIQDEHYLKGRHEYPYLGFDQTSICLVLYHNTPNNTFPVIWQGSQALFPRKQRHK